MAGKPSIVCDEPLCPLEAGIRALLPELKGKYDFRVEGERCGLCGKTKGWERKADGTVKAWRENVNT